jgi:hypothetical protein
VEKEITLMEKIDYKKANKELYLPKTIPSVIEVPVIPFIMIDGKGNPNEEEGEYSQAVSLLYALSYAIKMSKMGAVIPKGYFDYVVPPLEGRWWMADDEIGVDYSNKDKFCWISMIRQPEFVDENIFNWACSEVEKKKHLDTSKARLETFEEGLCVQCMHIGPFDEEPKTMEKMVQFMLDNHLKDDHSKERKHHEIYLSDPRKSDINKMKTVLRVPVKY